MSAYRDSLPSDALARYDAAIAQAAEVFVTACRDASAHGPAEAAKAAVYPGHRLGTAGAIAARCAELQEAARQEQAA